MGNTHNDIGCRTRRLGAPLAVVALAAVATAGCAAGSVTTTEGAGSTSSSARRPTGTILVVDPSGENAATMLGKSVAVIPPPTTPAPTTTTAAPTTVPTTLAPVTTPRVTAAPTVPTTPAPVTSLSIPSSKPALSPMNMASLSADEQSIVNGVNKIRAANGLAGVAPEQHATDTARQHAGVMAAAGQPSNIDDVFGKVNAAYKSITQITFNYPAGQDAAQFALGQYAGQLAGPFTSMGIGVVVSAGQRYIVVLIGA